MLWHPPSPRRHPGGVMAPPRGGRGERRWRGATRGGVGPPPLAEGGPMDLLTDTIRPSVAAPAARPAAARRSYARLAPAPEPPNLVEHQRASFRWFVAEGLRELLTEISPIQDYNQ